jgi:hypothetical protein
MRFFGFLVKNVYDCTPHANRGADHPMGHNKSVFAVADDVENEPKTEQPGN